MFHNTHIPVTGIGQTLVHRDDEERLTWKINEPFLFFIFLIKAVLRKSCNYLTLLQSVVLCIATSRSPRAHHYRRHHRRHHLQHHSVSTVTTTDTLQQLNQPGRYIFHISTLTQPLSSLLINPYDSDTYLTTPAPS